MAAGQTRGRVRNPAMYKARAMQMLDQKIKGMSMVEIAKQWQLSTDTVSRSLEWAVRQGLTHNYESQILSDLVPLAMGIYKKQLEAGDPFVAKDVMDKMTKLGDRFDKRETVQEQAGLGAYLAEKRMALMAGKQQQTKGVTDAGTIDPTNSAESGAADLAASTVATGFVSTYLDDFAGDGEGEFDDPDAALVEARGRTALGQDGALPDIDGESYPTIEIAVATDGTAVGEGMDE